MPTFVVALSVDKHLQSQIPEDISFDSDVLEFFACQI